MFSIHIISVKKYLFCIPFKCVFNYGSRNISNFLKWLRLSRNLATLDPLDNNRQTWYWPSQHNVNTVLKALFKISQCVLLPRDKLNLQSSKGVYKIICSYGAEYIKYSSIRTSTTGVPNKSAVFDSIIQTIIHSSIPHSF